MTDQDSPQPQDQSLTPDSSDARSRRGNLPDDVDFSELHREFPSQSSDYIDRSVIYGSGIKDLAQWCLRLLIIGVFVFASWFVLSQTWKGILPLILALLVCTVLAPPTNWMRNKGVPGALAAAITILSTFASAGVLFWLVFPQVARESQTLYFQAFEGVQRLQLWLQSPPFNLDTDDLGEAVNQAVSWLQRQSFNIANGIFTGLSTMTSIVVTLFVVLVLTFFFLKDGHRFLPWVRRATGRKIGWHLTEVLTRAWSTLGGFIRAQAAVSFVDAIFIGLGLSLIGVPLALPLAVLTFAAGFIPYIGAISAGALSVVIALISLGLTKALITLGLILLIQQLEGNVLSPILQSRAMDLHPVIVLISVTVGGALFGIVGAFLAVPAAAMIAVGFRFLQDMAAIRSGEKKASEVSFATNAGAWTGLYAEEAGRRMRQEFRESTISLPSHSSSAEADAAPVEEHSTAEHTSSLVARIAEATESLGKILDSQGNRLNKFHHKQPPSSDPDNSGDAKE
ncbi:AI-2E family transporter [Corynebacterium poyangense]|uniref:AI-2E family transporter n=1 Tax=Corynebacterium poyangense TaxID=2684405 RepID=UPI00165CF3AE